MADISFDNATSVGVSGSGSLTVAANASMVVAYVTQFGNTTPPSVTFGGQSMTYIGTSGQGNNLNVFGLILINPPTGSQNFTTTFGGGANSITVGSYIATNLSTTPDVTKATLVSANSTASSTITTILDRDWVLMGWYTDGTFSSLTNATQRASGINGAGMADSNGVITPPGNDTQTVNLTGSNNTAIFQMAIPPLQPSNQVSGAFAYII